MTDTFFDSRFARVADDFYPTIDTRTVDGLLAHVPLTGRIVDPCSPDGSGIVDYLVHRGYDAVCVGDALSDFEADWIVFNPPYLRNVVNDIIYRQIERLERGEVKGVAVLLRSIFHYAKTRQPMFNRSTYAGVINLCFRVWWFDTRDQEPKHNYTWRLWDLDGGAKERFYYAPYDERYTVKKGKTK